MIRLMLIGRKGSGKDTIAEIIRKKRPEVQRHAFADALKRDAKDLLKIAKDRFGVHGAPNFDMGDGDGWRALMRPFWQWYGTDFVRTYDPDHWIRRFDYSYGHLSNVVVTDCRFANEAQYGKKNGFVLVRVMGPDRRGNEPAETVNHLSEIAMDDYACDMTIDNTGTLEQLEDDVLLRLLPFVESRSFLRPSNVW